MTKYELISLATGQGLYSQSRIGEHQGPILETCESSYRRWQKSNDPSRTDAGQT